MTNRNHSKRKPHAQARATTVITVAHAPREERRGPVKGWQGLCVSGEKGGPVQRLTMAALTPTIQTKGQDHGEERIRADHAGLPPSADGKPLAGFHRDFEGVARRSAAPEEPSDGPRRGARGSDSEPPRTRQSAGRLPVTGRPPWRGPGASELAPKASRYGRSSGETSPSVRRGVSPGNCARLTARLRMGCSRISRSARCSSSINIGTSAMGSLLCFFGRTALVLPGVVQAKQPIAKR